MRSVTSFLCWLRFGILSYFSSAVELTPSGGRSKLLLVLALAAMNLQGLVLVQSGRVWINVVSWLSPAHSGTFDIWHFHLRAAAKPVGSWPNDCNGFEQRTGRVAWTVAEWFVFRDSFVKLIWSGCDIMVSHSSGTWEMRFGALECSGDLWSFEVSIRRYQAIPSNAQGPITCFLFRWRTPRSRCLPNPGAMCQWVLPCFTYPCTGAIRLSGKP